MTPADLARVFGTRNAVPNFAPSWNLPPSQPALVVRHHPKTGERHLDLLRWGLIPHFERDPSPCSHAQQRPGRNSRKIAELPRRLCVPPLHCAGRGVLRMEARRQAEACPSPSRAPTAFRSPSAVIWESWTDPASGDITRSFAIVTTDANGNDGANP